MADAKSTVLASVLKVGTSKSTTCRKCVRFADACGKQLETIRVMKEPSDCPPSLDQAVLKRALGKYYKGKESEDTKTLFTWVLEFQQPSSDFMKFHKTLESGNVALENVMVRDENNRLNGTIRVKNIAVDKKVFIRVTSDKWKSFTDQAATCVASTSRMQSTFSFDIPVTPVRDGVKGAIEFCVCFQIGPFKDGTAAQEFWDSNGGKNYCLTARAEGNAKEAQLSQPVSYQPYSAQALPRCRSVPDGFPYCRKPTTHTSFNLYVR